MAAPVGPSRIAGVDDAGEVADLLDRFQVEYDGPTPGAEVLADRVRRHLAEGLSVFLLAPEPGAGVAQLRFREYLMTGTPVCMLEELYVVPDRRGQGFGRSLLETTLAVAAERGATSVELGTAERDAAARRLYEGFGFTNLEQEGQPDTRMLYYEREV